MTEGEPPILDYATPAAPSKPRVSPPRSAPTRIPIAEPEELIAYPPDPPRPIVPLVFSFLVVPIVLITVLLALGYAAFVPQH